MILKTKVYSSDAIDGGWEYYDGIKNATVYRDADLKCNCVRVSFENGADDGFVVPIEEMAYLLNDQGKTIDRIYGQRIEREVEELHATDGTVEIIEK